MSLLEKFPMVDQNTTITADDRPSENAPFDCVAAVVCAMCMYLNGIKQMDHDKYNPDKFKDMAYGEAFRNSGTAAIKYVEYCKSLGVKLYAVEAADYPSLIGQARKFLAAGKPVMFTMDDWIVDTSLPQYQGWTHVACWYRDDATTLTSMDPWGGFPRMKSDAGWMNVLRAKEIWIAEKIQQEDEIMPIDINSPEARGFKALDPSHWQDTGNGHIIQFGLLADYKKRGYAFLGRPWSNEITIAPGHAIQFYEFGVRQWVNGVVSSVSLYDDGPGTDPRLVAARKQIQPPQADPRIAQYTEKLNQINTISKL
jgi:hypothetical protein